MAKKSNKPKSQFIELGDPEQSVDMINTEISDVVDPELENGTITNEEYESICNNDEPLSKNTPMATLETDYRSLLRDKTLIMLFDFFKDEMDNLELFNYLKEHGPKIVNDFNYVDFMMYKILYKLLKSK
ncbi:MAG: hypothetical protein WC549_01905 [Actinomycetota bacterium]